MTGAFLQQGLAAFELHELQRGEDRRKRIAELVAEHCQELILRPVGRFGLSPRSREIQQRSDASRELAGGEGLDEVVVGAGQRAGCCARTGLVSVPTFSIAQTPVSPALRYTGGVRPSPTPPGVPVPMMSPGMRVAILDA